MPPKQARRGTPPSRNVRQRASMPPANAPQPSVRARDRGRETHRPSHGRSSSREWQWPPRCWHSNGRERYVTRPTPRRHSTIACNSQIELVNKFWVSEAALPPALPPALRLLLGPTLRLTREQRTLPIR